MCHCQVWLLLAPGPTAVPQSLAPGLHTELLPWCSGRQPRPQRPGLTQTLQLTLLTPNGPLVPGQVLPQSVG